MTTDDPRTAPREAMEFDVVIVGAGPAGLSAAIRLKQQAPDASVAVLEKGAEVGAHILSGAVIDPVGLDALLPDWRERGAPVTQAVTADRFLLLGPEGQIGLPGWLMPPLMSNHGNYIISLGEVCRWLAGEAEALGVEIFPGFAAVEALRGEDGAVIGVASGDMGVEKSGAAGANYQRGVELRARYTLIAEGAHGSLAKVLMRDFDLRKGCEPQKYGIGLKEVWELTSEQHRPGLVQHTLGWPLSDRTGGGSFIYHYGERLAAVGFVVHLNYANPHLSPFDEFQKWKTHTAIAATLQGGKRLSYGARAITEGGWQSVPRLIFPGGALLGCAAGFVNVPRIKGSHNAMLSGIQVADAVADALEADRAHDLLDAYEAGWRSSAIGRDLRPVRNAKPLLSRFGTLAGTVLSGADMWLNTFVPWLSPTLRHGKGDHATLHLASEAARPAYPRRDGRITFDKLSSVFVSGTNHAEDQPTHLVLADTAVPIADNLPRYDEPAQRYCPAGVYEVVWEPAGVPSAGAGAQQQGGPPVATAMATGGAAVERGVSGHDGPKGTGHAGMRPRFQINAQNCVHCKTCDIKDPSQNITWVPPEGGGGPNYRGM